jgi:hypothetical protein
MGKSPSADLQTRTARYLSGGAKNVAPRRQSQRTPQASTYGTVLGTQSPAKAYIGVPKSVFNGR